jgi:signal transduction histidine kinase
MVREVAAQWRRAVCHQRNRSPEMCGCAYRGFPPSTAQSVRRILVLVYHSAERINAIGGLGIAVATFWVALLNLALIMKRKLIAVLSHRYVKALRKHLEPGPQASFQSARRMGRQAAEIGLETLELARIHEGSVAQLQVSGSRPGMSKRANVFFNEAIAPIEATHRSAVETNAHLNQLRKTLTRRTVDLAASRRSLKQGIKQRKTVERAVRKRGKHSQKLLKESRQLQKDLQDLTHQILAAQEEKRKKISHHLRDEIAQTLLGINVRLLTLKRESRANAEHLTKEIASTQSLVNQSVKTINRFARGFGKRQENLI